MVLKNKLSNFVNKQFSLSVFEIALSGLFVALWIVAGKVIKIDIGFMRIGILYALVIAIGLIFKPLLALIITILADTLLQMINGLGTWMFEYAIIYPLMALLVSFLKKIARSKKDLTWAIFAFVIMFVAIVITFVISIIYRNFASKSQNEETFFMFNSTFVQVLLWVFTTIIMLVFIFMIVRYFKTKKTQLKIYISILVISTLMIIIFVWLWGPIAQIRFLERHQGKNAQELYANYYLFLVPRILKTAIILPIYVVIAGNIYWAYQCLNFKKQNQW